MSTVGGSPSFAVFDVGKSVDDCSSDKTKPYCVQGRFFLSSPVAKASDDDNRRLRNELQIITLIDTKSPDVQIYRWVATKPVTYVPESFSKEKLLGLTLYRVQFRMGNYSQDIINELPEDVRNAMLARAAKTGDPNDPETKYQIHRQLCTRTSFVDSFAILTKSMFYIRLVFNTVLCNPRNYPLLISGDNLLRDNSILLFLVLLLLDLPVQTIEDVHCAMLDKTPIDQAVREGVGDPNLYIIWLSSRKFWANALKNQLDAGFGNVRQYLIAAGVSEETQESIINLLQPPDAVKEEPVGPPPSYDQSTYESPEI